MLPGRKADVGCIAKDNRLFVEAILYRYRGEICQRVLEIGKIFINVGVDGHQKVFRKKYLN